MLCDDIPVSLSFYARHLHMSRVALANLVAWAQATGGNVLTVAGSTLPGPGSFYLDRGQRKIQAPRAWVEARQAEDAERRVQRKAVTP